jgi:hypothetical protein
VGEGANRRTCPLPFAKEKIAEIEQRQKDKQERLNRKKPKLTIVPGGVS